MRWLGNGPSRNLFSLSEHCYVPCGSGISCETSSFPPMSITMDRPEWTDLDEQSLSKQPMLPQAMAQLIVSQSQRFGGRSLVETMLIERRLQNRHFLLIDRVAEITHVINDPRDRKSTLLHST